MKKYRWNTNYAFVTGVLDNYKDKLSYEAIGELYVKFHNKDCMPDVSLKELSHNTLKELEDLKLIEEIERYYSFGDIFLFNNEYYILSHIDCTSINFIGLSTGNIFTKLINIPDTGIYSIPGSKIPTKLVYVPDVKIGIVKK